MTESIHGPGPDAEAKYIKYWQSQITLAQAMMAEATAKLGLLDIEVPKQEG